MRWPGAPGNSAEIKRRVGEKDLRYAALLPGRGDCWTGRMNDRQCGKGGFHDFRCVPLSSFGTGADRATTVDQNQNSHQWSEEMFIFVHGPVLIYFPRSLPCSRNCPADDYSAFLSFSSSPFEGGVSLSSVVPFDYAIHHCQTEACAFTLFFGGEERFKYLLHYFFRDTSSVVLDS